MDGFNKNDKVHVNVGGKRIKADVVKQNPLTVLARLPDGNIIKRHKVKHHVHSYVGVFKRFEQL